MDHTALDTAADRKSTDAELNLEVQIPMQPTSSEVAPEQCGPEMELDPEVALRAALVSSLLLSCETPAPTGTPQQGRVVSAPAVIKFVEMHRCISTQRGLRLALPRIVFHWTQERHFKSIVENGLKVPDGSKVTISHGSSFGLGIYVSPEFRYGREFFAYGANAAFMCLALPGKQHFGKPPTEREKLHGVDGYDSVVGREGQRGVDEWVFFDSDQLLTCFLVDKVGLIPATEAARAAIKALHKPWPEEATTVAASVSEAPPTPSACNSGEESHADDFKTQHNDSVAEPGSSSGRWSRRQRACGSSLGQTNTDVRSEHICKDRFHRWDRNITQAEQGAQKKKSCP